MSEAGGPVALAGQLPVDAGRASLWELVRARIDETPEAVAIVAGSSTATYAELGDRIARHAAELRVDWGVAEEAVVALALPRSIELVAWELAILACGGAFMPLDPREPPERRRMITEDAGAVLVIDDGGMHPGTGPAPPRPAGPPATGGARAAYVLYTSGSTGRPKGVVTEDRSVTRYIEFVVGHYALAAGDVQVHFCSPGFDIAIEEIFSTLAAGATLLIHGPEDDLSAGSFLAWTTENRATVLNLPTGAFRQFATDLARDRSLRVPATVRLVVIGGDAATVESVAAWHGAADAALRIVNAYGPTETTISVCMADLEPGMPITIGRPVDGATVFVADARLDDVADGQAGELCIEGWPLARGYLGDPTLTAERFPVLAGGRRVYRTGDRGRVLPGGTIELLGRMDDQVKVRGGFRVEPGEVRAALLAHPEVQDAFVDHFDAAGARKLVAYLVTPGEVDQTRLRAHLAERLPGFMIPSSFVPLRALPLTARGKLDRVALRSLLGERPADAGGPGVGDGLDDLRALISAEWRSVLGRAPEDDDENFFEVGGDSLGSAQMIGALHDTAGVQIQLRRFFTDPTPRGLLEEILVDRDAAPSVHHTSGRTVVRLRRRGAGRLWCFMPPLSGAVTRYASMARLLPLGEDVWACETPPRLAGLGMERLASGLAAALVESGLGGLRAICLTGYSLGGVIAFEVARELLACADLDRTRVDVLMLDPPPPGIAMATLAETLAIFVNVGWRIDRDAGDFLRPDGTVAVAAIAEAARAAGVLPPGAADAEIADSWSVYLHNAALLEGYWPRPLPGLTPGLLRCAGPASAVADADATSDTPSTWITAPVPRDWAGVVDEDRCFSIGIDHFRLMEAPTDRVVAQWLTSLAV